MEASNQALHAFLSVPRAGERTLAGLQRKLCLLALRELLEPSRPLPAAVAAAQRRIAPLLSECARRAPDAVLGVLATPDVLVHALCMRTGVEEPAQAFERAVPHVLVGLAEAGVLGAEALLWDRPVERVVSRAHNRALSLRQPAQGLWVHATGAELRLADGTLFNLEQSDAAHADCDVSQPFMPLAGIHERAFSLLDTNPLAHVEQHPNKQGNALDLGGRSAAEWVAKLDEAIDVVRFGLPELAAELALSLQRVVPVGYEPELHLSASYREAPGLVYLTLHPSTLTLAEAIVHETQHGKLNALSWFDPVLHNGHSEWSASPVRPDLRPLMGVLLAVHAFVPVAVLHAELKRRDWPGSRGPEFEQRRLEVLRGNADGLATLHAKAKPTPTGERLLSGLDQLHAYAAAQ